MWSEPTRYNNDDNARGAMCRFFMPTLSSFSFCNANVRLVLFCMMFELFIHEHYFQSTKCHVNLLHDFKRFQLRYCRSLIKILTNVEILKNAVENYSEIGKEIVNSDSSLFYVLTFIQIS